MKNYYEILGISPDVDQSNIKTAAQAKANEINEAFRVLNDPQKRREYDLTLPQQQSAKHFANDSQKLEEYDLDLSQQPIKHHEQTSIAKQKETPPKFKTKGENRQWLKNMLNSWGEYLHLETPSLRDVMIFTIALVFFVYMLMQFIFPPPITPPSQPTLSLGKYSSDKD